MQLIINPLTGNLDASNPAGGGFITGGINIKAYGARGDGINDDTSAIQNALNANSEIYIPSGTFLTTSALTITGNKTIRGVGSSAIIKATGNSYDVFQVIGANNIVYGIETQNGLSGFRLFGSTSECTENHLMDITIDQATYGLVLDGYQSLSNPCYWNNFYRILISKPSIHGIWLTKSGAGDTPNANKFHSCRVYSHGTANTGDGIFVEYGDYNNSFIDCEANVSTSATNCIHLGASANKTVFINPYTETTGSVTNILLDATSGSLRKNMVHNHMAASAGAAIVDNSGGNYTAYNSPSTSSGAQNFLQNVNIGYPIRVVANTLNSLVQIHGLDSDSANSSIFIYRNNNVGARLSINKSRSTTLGNQGAVTNNDQIGYIDFNASDNSHFIEAASVWGVVDASVTPSSGIVPGRLQFMTANAAGTLTEGMRIDSSQNTTLAGSLTIKNSTMISTTTSFTNGAAAAIGTITNAPTSGNPTKWIPINDNGTTRYIPAW